MKPDIAKKWVEALRSGQYQQSKGRLHTRDGGFCCLGVLCDIVKDEIGGRWEVNTTSCDHRDCFDFVAPRFVGYDPLVKEQTALPLPVHNYVDFHSAWGTFMTADKSKTLSLAGLNDQGSTFAEIADVIEKHAEEL